MSEHYIVALDQGHLRIYAERKMPDQTTPGLEEVESMDFPNGKRAYFANDTSPQGRFPGAGPGGGSRHPGMSIDERLPMKQESERRTAKQLAEEVEAFFSNHPGATWDFAAGPELHNAVLELISASTRQRLRRAVSKDLVKHRPQELLAQFAAAGPGR
jgi:hypothetical protein